MEQALTQIVYAVGFILWMIGVWLAIEVWRHFWRGK